VLVRNTKRFRGDEHEPQHQQGAGSSGRAPVAEITNLLVTFVNPLRWILLAITVMICIVSGIGILVSIYNSMSDRAA